MLKLDDHMTHELKDTFLDVSSPEISVEKQNAAASHSRQNLAGGKGVFANFFEEMAEPLTFQSSLTDDGAHACALGTDYRLSPQICDGETNLSPCIHDGISPMQAFYGDNPDDDLEILERYRMFVNQNADAKLYEDTAFQLDRSTNDDTLKCGSLSRVVTEYNPTDLSSQLCISYIHRSKPPKILANRFLLGSTIGRGSYGKVKDAIDLYTLRRHAVKIISKLGVRKIPGGWNQALHEVSFMRRLSACRHVVSLVTVLRLQNPDRLCLVMEHCLGSVHDLQAAGVPSQTALSSENEYDRREDNFVKPSQLSYFKGKHEIQAGCEDTSKPAVTSKSSPLKFNKIRRFHTRLPMISTQVNQEEDIKISKLKSRKVSTIEHSSHRNEKNPSSPSQQQQFRRLPEAQAHAYFLQLIDGLHFLHRNGVIHRDIKPANLLLTPAPGCGLSEFGSPNGTMDLPDHNWLCSNGGQSSFCGRPLADLLAASRGWLVKLADFGVSASVSAFSSNDMVSGGQTTPAVQPPEVAKGVQSIFDGTKLDVYSAGVTLYFMLTGRVPFSCQNVLQIFEAIVKGDYTIPGHVSANASDLIRKMMHKDPKKRLTLLQIRQQTWCIQDPSPPISVEKIKMKLYNNLSSQSNDTVSRQTCTMKRRGTICWLDPLIYLRRSNAEYPPPHIDDTGARIFSIEEVFNDPTIILKHENPTDQEISSKPVNDDVVENLEDAIAPFSVIDRLKVYHDVDDYDDYSRLEDMSSFYHSPEACLQYSGLESHLANLGIVSCIESEPVSKLQSAYNAPGTSVHNDSLNYLSPGKMFHPSNSHPCCTCDQYISQQPVNSKINQHLSQDVSLLPAYEAAHPTIQGIPTPANLNNLPEPPVCPADLPISLPTSSFKLPTFTMDSSTAFRSGSLPDPVDLIPSNLDICQRMQNSVIESLNQKTWHSGSRLKHQQNLINFNGNQQLETMSKDVDQISSDFDTDGTASFFLQDNFSPTTTTIIHTSRKKKSKQLMKTVMNSQPSGGGGVQRLTRWFSNPFNVFRNRIKSLRNKDLSISNHPLPTSSIHQHRTVNSASELASVIEKYPIEEVIQSTDSLPIANCVPKPTSRIFSSKKFSFKK